jgi:hypothetical protein
MRLPFLNTAPGYDEELRNSVFFERGLHATSICGAVRRRRGRARGPPLALPDARSVEDLTALLTSAGER